MEDGPFLKQHPFLLGKPLFLAVLKFSVEVPLENGELDTIVFSPRLNNNGCQN